MDELVLTAIENSTSMSEALSKVSHIVGKQKFREIAIKYNVYKPNYISGKREKIDLSDVLSGKLQYSSSSLRRRLIAEGYKDEKCECCGQSQWMGQKIPLSLHHIDGNHSNNSFENLQILCFNCHALTDNFGAKNKKLF